MGEPARRRLSHIDTVDETRAEGATAELYAEERARVGHLPRHVRAFGARPETCRAWQRPSRAVSSPMSPRRHELVTLAAARALRSSYCSLAHGSILAEHHLPAADVARLAAGQESDAIDACERAVMRFAAKAARSAADIAAEDVEALRAHGPGDEEILDVVPATAARCFFGTVLDATGTRPDAACGRMADAAPRDALALGRPIADA